MEIANSQSVGVCNVTYGSSCSINCSSGFSVSGNGEHVCDDVNDEGTSVNWRSVGGAFNCVAVGKSVSWTTIVVHNRDRHMFILFILLLLLLFIFDTPTAKLADFLTLASTDACR